jgi:hypothetical protein
MNVCSTCGLDFASVAAFDAHRVGKFLQTGSGEYRGPLEDWIQAKGRRCLTLDELNAGGWERDPRGRWRKCPSGRSQPLSVTATSPAIPSTKAPDGTSQEDNHPALPEPVPGRPFSRNGSTRCDTCGRSLAGRRADAKHCSEACRQRAYRVRKASHRSSGQMVSPWGRP